MLELTLPDHDAALAGDTLYSIQFNHEWRRIVASALQFYWQHGDEGLALDNEDLLNNVLIDLYNAEALNMGIKTNAQNVSLFANQTTTSPIAVPMPNSGLSYTPTKANVRVTCSNISLLNSNTNQTEAEIRANGVVGTARANAIVANTTIRPVRASGLFTNLPIGVAATFSLYWKVTGGTGTANWQSQLVWEFFEYD